MRRTWRPSWMGLRQAMTKYNKDQRLAKLRQIGVLYDLEDEPMLAQYSWHINNTGYAFARGILESEPEKVLMHRVIMGVSNDKKATVDHINRTRTDNRKENLRLVSRSENSVNSVRSDSATYITKRSESGCYRVQIRRNGIVYSKSTKTIAEAQAWRDGFFDGSICPEGWTPPVLDKLI